MVYIVNIADNFHSLNSYRLVGVGTSFKKALKLIKKHAKEENIKLDAGDIENLKTINQTQASNFDGEFNIKCIELNKLV